MIAAPAGFTARFTAWPRGAKVFTRVHLPPAGRLAVSIAPLTPAQAAIALPDPSMPITGPPKASVDRITAVLHWPPGGRTLAWTVAWTMAGVTTTPSHTATARPSRAIATAGGTPRARGAGPDPVLPSPLGQARPGVLVAGFCWYPAGARATAAQASTRSLAAVLTAGW